MKNFGYLSKFIWRRESEGIFTQSPLLKNLFVILRNNRIADVRAREFASRKTPRKSSLNMSPFPNSNSPTRTSARLISRMTYRQHSVIHYGILFIFLWAFLGCNRSAPPSSLRGVPDSELARRLTGTWILSVINTNSVVFAGEVSYQRNGSVIWQGTTTDKNGPQIFGVQGTWRIQDGFLYTRPINSTLPGMQNRPEDRDELISISETEFVYRDSAGIVTTRRKRK